MLTMWADAQTHAMAAGRKRKNGGSFAAEIKKTLIDQSHPGVGTTIAPSLRQSMATAVRKGAWRIPSQCLIEHARSCFRPDIIGRQDNNAPHRTIARTRVTDIRHDWPAHSRAALFVRTPCRA
jgi:hypothetical protein